MPPTGRMMANGRSPRILSTIELGVDAGVTSGLVLMSGWSRSVRPFAAPQRG